MNTVIERFYLTKDVAMPLSTYTILSINRGAELLYINMVAGLPTLWVRLDPDAEEVRRVFHTLIEGNPPDHDAVRAEYVDSYLVGGELYGHVFVEPEPEIDDEV